MGLAAQGAVRNLLDAAWQQGGKLPNVPEVLWKYANAQTPQEFDAVAVEALSMFEVTQDGQFLINAALTEALEDAEARLEHVRQVRSDAGKKGNEARWGNRKVANHSQPEARAASQTIATDRTDVTDMTNVTEQNDTSCAPAPSAATPAACGISLPLNDGREAHVTEEDLAEWIKLYPAVDVVQQLRNMRGWLLANTANRKTSRGIGKFINRWLAKEQNQAPRMPAGEPASAESTVPTAQAPAEFKLPAVVDVASGQKAWSRLLAKMDRAVSKHSRETWLKPLRVIGIHRGALCLQIPTPEFRYVKNKFAEQMATPLQELGLNDIVLLLPEELETHTWSTEVPPQPKASGETSFYRRQFVQ